MAGSKKESISGSWRENYLQLQTKADLAAQLNKAGIDCMLAMGLDERILYWNNTCVEVSGLTDEALLDQPFRSVFPSTSSNQLITSAFEQVKKGFKVFVPSTQDMWIPGHFELHLVPLSESNGTQTGIVFIAHDVAHRAYAEQQLDALNRKLAARYTELERANATLATFSHITGNEFKEPLRRIYSALERVIMEEGNLLMPKGRSAIRKVQSTAQRLGLLADSLTTFSDAKQKMEETVCLEDVLLQVQVALRQQLHEVHASIELENLPKVKGDHAQLKMLFNQLVSNALKFQSAGNLPSIKIWAAPVNATELPSELHGRDLGYLAIYVRDNGIGIQEEDQERIFQLFEKGQQEKRFKGAGLGLALARKIAENHEGTLKVGRAPATGGTTIVCYLPIMQ